ncbi:MAG: quinolinate synthase NadA [Candidatus Bathyarchaeia archaeon]
MVNSEIAARLLELKREKRALILAHNYQRPEVQDVADFVGDSVELSRKAMNEQDSRIILFSAVDFMAETAAILNPTKKVLLPSLGARCPMAHMLPAETVRAWKSRYPGVPVVLYVNTLAESKAESDVSCTSANAVKVVESLDSDKVLFGPDRHLARYVAEKTGKTVIAVPENGFCPTHVLFLKEDVLLAKEANPGSIVMAHPECVEEVLKCADFIGSTSQICRFAKECPAKSFVVATEVGILHRLKKENPGKSFTPAYAGAVCPSMKRNTLELMYQVLRDESNVVRVPPSIAARARRSIERMFEATK